MQTEDKVSKQEELTLQVVKVEVEVVQHQRLDVEVLAEIEASVEKSEDDIKITEIE